MSWAADAIVVAAGEGLRMGGDQPKQFLEVAGRPLLAHSLMTFEVHPRVAGIFLVLPADRLAEAETAVEGGVRRRDSVRAGLDAIAAHRPVTSDLLVAVHDGARPLLRLDLLGRVLEAAAEHGAAVPVLPVRDTMVEVAAEETLGDSVDRRTLRSVQTPQVFRFDWLREAHERYGDEDATDDAGMVREAGYPVRLVSGDVMNFKVTDPDDLELVACVLAGEVNRG